MARIFEFPQKITQAKETKDSKLEVKSEETMEAAGRIIRAITENKLEEKNTVTDLEALKDIFSIFSVQEGEMVNLLSKVEEEKRIDRNDTVLLFAIFVTLKKNHLENIVNKVIKGMAGEEISEDINQEVKKYLLRINLKIKQTSN